MSDTIEVTVWVRVDAAGRAVADCCPTQLGAEWHADHGDIDPTVPATVARVQVRVPRPAVAVVHADAVPEAQTCATVTAPSEYEEEARWLLDHNGEWTGGRAWWARAGYTDGDPPTALFDAVKREQHRRKGTPAPPLTPGASTLLFVRERRE